ncbi:hypothetical protein, partial [Allochromatium vinosum]|uniref:hypothetical protein n=1 Tax=Allochromatium vinosum TaxID=1049 RepID=UPI001A930BB1
PPHDPIWFALKTTLPTALTVSAFFRSTGTVVILHRFLMGIATLCPSYETLKNPIATALKMVKGTAGTPTPGTAAPSTIQARDQADSLITTGDSRMSCTFKWFPPRPRPGN